MGVHHLWRLYRKHGVDVVRPIELSVEILLTTVSSLMAGLVSMIVLSCPSSVYLQYFRSAKPEVLSAGVEKSGR